MDDLHKVINHKGVKKTVAITKIEYIEKWCEAIKDFDRLQSHLNTYEKTQLSKAQGILVGLVAVAARDFPIGE